MSLDFVLMAAVAIPLVSFVFLALFASKLPGVAAAAHGHDDHGHGDHGAGHGHDAAHGHGDSHGHSDTHGHGDHGHFPPKVKRPPGGNPWAGYIATAAIALSCACSSYVLLKWTGMESAERVAYAAKATADHTIHWATLGDMRLTFAVKLDSLTVIMMFMVTFVSTWIHVFSLGYMCHDPRFHRFFTYLSLFCFSMLGLVISNSLLFLFIFWEMVGLCSYFLIGFWFEKKSASNAAIKAFVTNRVGDLGFLVGLMMVVMFLREVNLDGAAAAFKTAAAGAATHPLFTNHFLGFTWATWMGIGLFCGAVGKSAQFPLHVWLPDAMEGPTPVSALIHAATMVAAGVYLVARIFALLTPDAQMVIATIGCITLTMTALIAVAQTDIKKVLAYSTLSQLGYMIFGMGVGAWIGALFHLLTHAFFKALLFLGSGQVIEGCHHEQDMRKMGGLARKMPVTCWTFFLAVLAIAGAGIPWMHFGLGGYYSKDEILVVAYQRAFLWDKPIHHEAEHAATNFGASVANAAEPESIALVSRTEDGKAEHADHATPGMTSGSHGAGSGHGASLAAMFPAVPRLPKWMFWLPIVIAYITPFYMMRCWAMTFAGKPRDQHIHDHAGEKPIMWVPLAVLAVFTIVCATIPFTSFRHLVADAAQGLPAEVVGSKVSTLVPAISGELLHDAHVAMGSFVGFAFVVGMGLAWLIYGKGLGIADAILRSSRLLRGIHRALSRRLYIDDVYDFVLVGGTVLLARIAYAFDKYIIDGLVNLSAALTRVWAFFTGRQLDMPVKPGDVGLVDAMVNGVANIAYTAGGALRRPQSGRIRLYILSAAGVVSLALLFVVFADDLVRWTAQTSGGAKVHSIK